MFRLLSHYLYLEQHFPDPVCTPPGVILLLSWQHWIQCFLFTVEDTMLHCTEHRQDLETK